jgi:hypothetical protein
VIPASAAAGAAPVGPTKARLIAVGDGSPRSAISSLVSDRQRYIAYIPSGSSDVATYDTKRGAPGFRVPGCGPVDGTPGYFLAGCGADGSDDRLLEARNHRLSTIAGSAKYDEFWEIGRQWARGETIPERDAHSTEVIVNWRTGERRTCNYYPPLGDPCPPRNLDSKRGEVIDWGQFGHEPHYSYDELGGLTLRHDRRVVARFARPSGCDEGCGTQLYAGRLSWHRPRPGKQFAYVNAYAISSGHSVRWRIAAPPDCRGPSWLGRVGHVHTRYAMAIEVLDRGPGNCDESSFLRLWVAPWPKSESRGVWVETRPRSLAGRKP